MLHNPNDLINKNLISGTLSVQPNAIDFTLDELYLIEPSLTYISNNKTLVQHRTRNKVSLVTPESLRDSHAFGNVTEEPNLASGWFLAPNSSYDGTSNVYVEVPEGMAAFLVVRSTLNRNAIVLTSGLYDSGFKGHIGFTIHTKAGNTFIEKGTYVGQIMFMASDSAGTYSGGYNTEVGQHWTAPIGTTEEHPLVITEPTTIDLPANALLEINVVEAPVVPSTQPAEIPMPIPTPMEVPVMEPAPIEAPVMEPVEGPTEVVVEVPAVEPTPVEPPAEPMVEPTAPVETLTTYAEPTERRARRK